MLISIMSGPGVVSFGIFFYAQDCVFCVRRQVKKRVLKTSLVAEIGWLECFRCQNQGCEGEIWPDLQKALALTAVRA